MNYCGGSFSHQINNSASLWGTGQSACPLEMSFSRSKTALVARLIAGGGLFSSDPIKISERATAQSPEGFARRQLAKAALSGHIAKHNRP